MEEGVRKKKKKGLTAKTCGKFGCGKQRAKQGKKKRNYVVKPHKKETKEGGMTEKSIVQ